MVSVSLRFLEEFKVVFLHAVDKRKERRYVSDFIAKSGLCMVTSVGKSDWVGVRIGWVV